MGNNETVRGLFSWLQITAMVTVYKMERHWVFWAEARCFRYYVVKRGITLGAERRLRCKENHMVFPVGHVDESELQED